MRKLVTGRRGVIGLLIVVFITGGVSAATITAGNSDSKTPETLKSEGALETLPATKREYSARSAREVEFTFAPELPLLAAAGGRVTSTTCNPAEPLKSGTKILEINGDQVHALYTEVPLWRDLPLNTRGKDVKSLHKELKRLEIADLEGDRVTQASLNAFAKFTGQTRATQISLDRLVWLPAKTVDLQSCELTIGEQVSPNDIVALLKPEPELAHVNNWSTTIDGEYSLQIGDTTVPMATDGVLNDHDSLTQLSETPEFQAVINAERPVTNGFTSLTKPLEVWAVPPSGVVSPGGETGCVESDGTPTPIRVIASELGQTLVETINETELGNITVKPDPNLKCA